jgi:hypothetical protein
MSEKDAWVFSEDGFDGEVLEAFASDPFGLGGVGSGKLSAAVGVLREVAMAHREATGRPYPTEYKVKIAVVKDDFEITFKAQ